MKKQFCKTMSYVMTAALLLGVSMPSSPAAAKKKAPKLSTKKVSISVGQKKTIKLKNGKKAVWSIKSGKKVVSLSKKKKTSVVVKGKKAGKAVVLAKVGKKKLTCKVTVKAKKPAVTKAPAVTTAPNTNKPSTAPTATPTAVVPTPTATPEQGEAVKDITIDMTKVGDTEFSSSPATINFSSQLDARFDLAYFKEVKIGYELTFEGEDTSKLTAGKIAVAGTTEQLTGFDDGVAFNYNMAAGATSVSVAFDEKVTGPAVGLNIQPMDAAASYGWPETLKSVKITSIVFVARAGATYPAAGASKPTPKPTVAPEFESSEFKYDGLDQNWIDKNIDPEKPVVALSFDDGPGGYTGFVDNGMKIQKALTAAGERGNAGCRRKQKAFMLCKAGTDRQQLLAGGKRRCLFWRHGRGRLCDRSWKRRDKRHSSALVRGWKSLPGNPNADGARQHEIQTGNPCGQQSYRMKFIPDSSFVRYKADAQTSSAALPARKAVRKNRAINLRALSFGS